MFTSALIDDTTLLLSLNVPKGYRPCSYSDNSISFDNVDGKEIAFTLPFYVGMRGRCQVQSVDRAQDDSGDILCFYFFEEDPQGKYYVSQITASGANGQWFAVGVLANSNSNSNSK